MPPTHASYPSLSPSPPTLALSPSPPTLLQIAAHSLAVGEEAIELLLREARDIEYNLLGVCALGRILKSPSLAAALQDKMAYFAERLEVVLTRCEESVGARVLGLSQKTLPIAEVKFDDSVQVRPATADTGLEAA